MKLFQGFCQVIIYFVKNTMVKTFRKPKFAIWHNFKNPYIYIWSHNIWFFLLLFDKNRSWNTDLFLIISYLVIYVSLKNEIRNRFSCHSIGNLNMYCYLHRKQHTAYENWWNVDILEQLRQMTHLILCLAIICNIYFWE